jgi:hypothetical protein
VPQEISGSQWTEAGLVSQACRIEGRTCPRKTRCMRHAYGLFGHRIHIISSYEYIVYSYIIRSKNYQ